MTPAQIQHSVRELLHRLMETANTIWRRNRSVEEIARLDEQATREIAGDLGISTRDLRALAGQDKGLADLLVRRMATLGLEPEKLEAAVMHDLQRCCSLCRDKQLCVHELEDKPREATWPKYCPNEHTLAALSRRDS